MDIKDFFTQASGPISILGFTVSLFSLYYSSIKPQKQYVDMSLRYIEGNIDSYENNDEIIICIINSGMKEIYLSDICVSDYHGNRFLISPEKDGKKYDLYSEIKPGAAVLISANYIFDENGNREQYITSKIARVIRNVKDGKYKNMNIDFDIQVRVATTRNKSFYFKETVSKKLSELNYMGKPASEEIASVMF